MAAVFLAKLDISILTLPALILDKEKKLTQIFIFTLHCVALKAFIKPFEVPQRFVKIKV